MKKKVLFMIALLFAAAGAWAQFTPVYVNSSIGSDTYDGSSATVGTFPVGPKATIQAGIGAVSVGGTVNVATGTYSTASGETFPIAVNKAITLHGEGSSTTIIQPTSGTNAIAIGNSGSSENVLHYILEDIQLLVSGVGRGINTGDRDYISIELENITINYSETGRGIALGTTNGGTNNAISLLNSQIVCTATGISDPTNRGISFYHSANSSLTITNSTVTAGHYALTLNSPGLLVNIAGSTLTGYAALNMHNTGSTINISNSTLTGRSFWGGPSDTYGAIAFDGSMPCTNTTVNVTNSTITNLWVGIGATNFESPIYNDDASTGNKVYLDAASQLINTNWTKAPLCVNAIKGNFEWYVAGVLQNPVGVDLYVNAATGNDANSGEAPVLAKKTIQAAVTAAVATNVISVAAGNYTIGNNVTKTLTINGANAGIAGNGTRGDESIIDGNDLSSDYGFVVNTPSTTVIIDGFKFTDCSPVHEAFAGSWPTSIDLTFKNNYIYSAGELKCGNNTTYWRNVIIENNLFSYINSATQSSAVVLNQCTSALIQNNFLNNIAYNAFQITGVSAVDINNNNINTTGSASIQLAGAIGGGQVFKNVIINGNTNGDADKGGIRIYGPEFTGTVNITENTVTNSFNGFAVKDLQNITGKVINVNNNNFSGNSNKGIYHGGTGTLNANCNWWGTAVLSEISAKISGNVTYVPYNISVGGACEGSPVQVTRLGVVISNHTTIQAGIAAAMAGDVINVAAGTYTEQVTITKSLELIGAGEATTTILAPAVRSGSVTHNGTVHDYLLAAYATSGTIDVRVQGFTFDVNGQNKTSGTAQMDGVYFDDITDAGGTMAGLFASTIHNFAATPDYEGFGLVVYGNSLLTANDNNISDYTRDGISINRYGGTGSDPNVTISGNTITGTGTNLNGINIISVSAGAVTDNNVTGNTRSGPDAGGGIVLWTSTGVPVTGNHVDGNYYGIDLLAGAHDITISGNDLTNNIKRGISLSDADNNTVKSNTITGPVAGTDDVAIGIANTSTGNMIGGPLPADGNAITMAKTGSANLYAIHMQSDVGTGTNTIQNNTITGGQRAVQFDGSPGITVTSTVSYNTISGQGFGGILAYNNGDLIITNNTLTNAVRPIEFFGPVNLTVYGNTINGSTYAGINLGSFTGSASINDNSIYEVPADNHGIWVQASGAGLNIHGNTIHNIGERGIQVAGAATNAIIDGNEIYDVHGYAAIVIDGYPGLGATGAKINNNYIHDNQSGGVAANAQTAEFNGNRIINNDFGVELGAPGALFVLRDNSITGNDPTATACTNPKYGVCSGGLSVYNGTAIANNNYWGGNGPNDANLYPTATGDHVSANVSFIPWWCNANMTSSCPPLNTGMAIMNTNTGEQYPANDLSGALTDALDGQTLFVATGTPVAGTTYDFTGKTVYIIGTGVPGQSVLAGASPALTVTNGEVIVENGITFLNNSDEPTILVTGGSLTLRDCIVHEANGFTQSCLKVTGGTVDAGTLEDYGNNQFFVHGTGSAIDNQQAVALKAVYNDWGSANGPTIASNVGGDGGAIIDGTSSGDETKVDYAPWGGGPVTTAAAVTVCSGATTVDIPITVSRFNNIGSFSLTLAYNSAELSSPALKAGSVPAGITAWGLWEMNTTVTGTITISDYGALPSDGVTLDDGATLLTLTFNVGTITTPAVLSFVDVLGTSCEFTGVAPTYPHFGDTPAATNYRSGSVTVVPDPTLAQPANVAICKGGSTILSTAPSGGTGTYSYQWQYCDSEGGTFTNVVTGNPAGVTYANGSTTTLTITTSGSEASVAKYYKCLLSSATPVFGGCDAMTGAVNVTTVDDPIAPGLARNPNTDVVCVGQTLTADVTEGSGGTGTRTDEYSYDIGSGWSSWSVTVPSFTSVVGTNRIRSRSTNLGPGCESSVNEVSWTVNARQTISGKFTYYNLANTTLTELVSVQLVQTAGAVVSPTSTSDNPQTITGSGGYSFAGVCPSCTYEIRAASTHNTIGAINTTDAAMVNYWGPNPYDIEMVRFYAGDVNGDEFLSAAGDALKIQRNFVYGDHFTRSDWAFWSTGTTISANPLLANSLPEYPGVNLVVGNNLVVNMYGLATGDFNRSFDPSEMKAASATLDLIYAGNRQISSSQEFELPIQTVNASGVGAVSLILNFPVEFVEVLDVTMNGAGGQLDWAAKGNELRIGWNSSSPLYLSAGAELVTLKLRTTAAFTIGNPIRISLAADPLNELADAMYEVIGNAVLSVDVIEASTTGTPEMPAAPCTLSFSAYPNPFRNFTTITYTLPFDGKVVLEIYSIIGTRVATLVSETQPSGNHEVRFNTTGLPPGVYMATLRLKSANDELIRSIKLVYNK